MSDRDNFAMAAMQAMLSRVVSEETESGNRDFIPDYSHDHCFVLTMRAYQVADAMLAARKEKPA